MLFSSGPTIQQAGAVLLEKSHQGARSIYFWLFLMNLCSLLGIFRAKAEIPGRYTNLPWTLVINGGRWARGLEFYERRRTWHQRWGNKSLGIVFRFGGTIQLWDDSHFGHVFLSTRQAANGENSLPSSATLFRAALFWSVPRSIYFSLSPNLLPLNLPFIKIITRLFCCKNRRDCSWPTLLCNGRQWRRRWNRESHLN